MRVENHLLFGTLMLLAGAMGTAGIANAAKPQILVVGFDFSNATVGASTAPASFMGEVTSSAQWSTGDGSNDGILAWSPNTSYTQFYSTTHYPSMTFTISANIAAGNLTFWQSGNHNYSFDKHYQVNIVLDGNTIGSFVARAATSTKYCTFNMPTLAAGTHTIAWVPSPSTWGTNSDYFALRWISLTSSTAITP